MTPGSAAWRESFWGQGCDRGVIGSFYWTIASGGRIECHRNAIRAFRALGRVMARHGYPVRRDVTGCYNCRPITGGTAVSAHAQGIALDVNWDTNPYRLDRVVSDMPRAMIEDVQAIRTDAGVPAFRWGGDWDGRPETAHSNYDAMHFEVIATPAQIRAGFSVPGMVETDRRTWPLLDIDEKGEAVRHLQWFLAVEQPDIRQDGYFGLLTQAAVKRYQASRALPADGVVGYGTWTALIGRSPAVKPGELAPHKGQAAPA